MSYPNFPPESAHSSSPIFSSDFDDGSRFVHSIIDSMSFTFIYREHRSDLPTFVPHRAWKSAYNISEITTLPVQCYLSDKQLKSMSTYDAQLEIDNLHSILSVNDRKLLGEIRKHFSHTSKYDSSDKIDREKLDKLITSTRRCALERLSHYGEVLPDESVEQVVQYLSQAKYTKAASRALMSFAELDLSSSKELLKLFDSADPYIKDNALKSLSKASRHVVPQLIERFANSSTNEKLLLLNVFSQLGRKVSDYFLLLADISLSSNERVRSGFFKTALTIFRDEADLYSTLIRGMFDKSDVVRREAIYLLKKIEIVSSDFAAEVIRVYDNKNLQERREFLQNLSELENRAEPFLLPLLTRFISSDTSEEDETTNQRCEVKKVFPKGLWELSLLPELRKTLIQLKQSSVDSLKPLLKSDHSAIQLFALSTILEINKHALSSGELESLLSANYIPVRIKALEGLSVENNKVFQQVLAGLIGDSSRQSELLPCLSQPEILERLAKLGEPVAPIVFYTIDQQRSQGNFSTSYSKAVRSLAPVSNKLEALLIRRFKTVSRYSPRQREEASEYFYLLSQMDSPSIRTVNLLFSELNREDVPECASFSIAAARALVSLVDQKPLCEVILEEFSIKIQNKIIRDQLKLALELSQYKEGVYLQRLRGLIDSYERESHLQAIRSLSESKAKCVESASSPVSSHVHGLVANWRADELKTILLEYKSNLEIKDENCNAPLHTALRHAKPQTANLLISNGVDLNPINLNGEIPLLLAVSIGDSSIVKQLAKSGELINTRDNRGNSALSLAVEKGNSTIIEILLDAGADPNTIYDNRSLLNLAYTKQQIDIIKLLLEAGADINYRDPRTGRTLMHEATVEGNFEVVEALDKYNPDLQLLSCEGNNVLGIVRRKKRQL